jgi:hypothetical protein
VGLSAHTADALYVQPDDLFGPFKVANLGGVAGTLDQEGSGRAFTLTRPNRFASQSDISIDSIFELLDHLSLLQAQPFEEVHLSKVTISASADELFRRYRIDKVLQRTGPRQVRRGELAPAGPGQGRCRGPGPCPAGLLQAPRRPLNLDVTFRVGRLPAPPPQGRSGAAGAGMGAVA